MHLRRLPVALVAIVLLAGCAELRVTAEPTTAPIVGRETTIVATAVNGQPTDDITISENGAVLKRCNDALVCRLAVRSTVVGARTFRAEVWRGANTRPEASADIVIRWLATPDYEVSLTASDTSVAVGDVVILTATASADVGPSDFRIVLQQDFERVAACASGTVCRYRARHDTAGRHTYLATIETDAGAEEAVSDPIDVTWRTTTTTTSTTTTTMPVVVPDPGHIPPP